MRAGICNIQLQALIPEAATIVKQAVNLATRRGHAQVTPLHVASAMLATSTGLLRRACLQCHSHPLQSKALELCLNVALNRLPASTASPLLGTQYSIPSLSNALVAAFKRAQAHQRRGSIENQQQPILALKIEVEQLVISILDDPSVSRVMREAGFSSTLVRTRVEQAVSVEVCSQRPLSRNQSNKETISKPQALNGGGNMSPSSSLFGHFGGSVMKPFDHIKNTDGVTSVQSEILNKRRNTVFLGENLASVEGVARGVIERFERGNVPGDLKYMQFVSLPHTSFRSISREEVEQKLMEIRCLVKSYVGRGVVLYLGDLKWLFEFWSNYCEQRTNNYYCSVEHMVMELKKLVSGSGESNRMRLVGIATFRTYMKCKTCHPSLEALWDLHPFTIPVGCSLSLSINFDSDFQAQERSTVIKDGSFDDQAGVKKHLTCCRDCSANFDKDAQNIASRISKKECISSSSNLPIWLQNYKKGIRSCNIIDQENGSLMDLCKKWNSFCSSVHRRTSIILEKPLKLASSSPSPCTAVSSHEGKAKLYQSHLNWPVFSEPKEMPGDCELCTETGDDCYESNLIMFMPDRNVPKPDLLSNPNSSPNSASSSETVEGLESTQMFRELNPESLKILIEALESKVPQHKDIIPEIASTVLCCRSGMRKRENNSVKREEKLETWMFFLGVDSQAKEKVLKELANVVFGSYSNFVTVGLSSFSSSPRADSTEESKSKRARNEKGSSYLQRFWEEVNENPHRVFFMEDLDQVDYFSQKGIKKAIESGSLTLAGGESVPLKDAIIIFSSESFSSVLRACSARTAQPAGNEVREKQGNLEEKNLCLSLDLNMAIEDDTRDVHLVRDNGILELVDKQIFFEVRELIKLGK